MNDCINEWMNQSINICTDQPERKWTEEPYVAVQKESDVELMKSDMTRLKDRVVRLLKYVFTLIMVLFIVLTWYSLPDSSLPVLFYSPAVALIFVGFPEYSQIFCLLIFAGIKCV